MKELQELQDNPVFKQVLADSFGGIMYNVANRDKYNKEEVLAIWDNLAPVYQEAANGIVKGAINFLQGK